MNLPNTIKLGCFTFAIEQNDNVVDGNEVCDGVFDHEFMKIHLKKNLSDVDKLCTLWHEVKHACAWFVGADEDGLTEEQVVKRVEKAEVSVLVQNPELLALFKHFKKLK